VTSVGIDNQRTGSQTYVYDGNGNPTTYRGLSVSFDAENRMTMFFPPLSQPEINGYNGDGLRAWKHIGAGGSNSTTIYFLYDGTNLLCELNASGTVTATNTWGANGLVSRRVGTTSTFYVYDPQGSVAERLDASENVVSSDLYDAYGNKLAGNPNNDPYGYDGQWGYYTDSETGLALCTFRYYDPSNGRWLTRDPIGYRGGVDLYGYVGDDPANAVDSLGHTREECLKEADDWANSRHDACAKAFKRHKNRARYVACEAAIRAVYYPWISACYGEAAADATFNFCYKNRATILAGPVIVVGGAIIISTGGTGGLVLAAL
jgi:RHS repeat-associated protein